MFHNLPTSTQTEDRFTRCESLMSKPKPEGQDGCAFSLYGFYRGGRRTHGLCYADPILKCRRHAGNSGSNGWYLWWDPCKIPNVLFTCELLFLFAMVDPIVHSASWLQEVAVRLVRLLQSDIHSTTLEMVHSYFWFETTNKMSGCGDFLQEDYLLCDFSHVLFPNA